MMVVGYRFLLKRVAAKMDSGEDLTISSLASSLDLRQDEFRDILNIMVKKGDIECIVEDQVHCGGGCGSCSRSCAFPGLMPQNRSLRSYRLTDKGRALCK